MIMIVLILPPLYRLIFRRGMRSSFAISSAEIYRHSGNNISILLKKAFSYLRIVAYIALVVAISGPQRAKNLGRTVHTKGIDMVLVLDISTSMLAVDFRPKNRITAAKEVISQFLDTRKSDRVGLVVFAGEAYVQCPLTLDYDIIKELLDGVEPGNIKDGTAIGDALVTALNRLKDSKAKSKIIVLITDGANNAGSVSPEKAAEIAKSMNVEVFTIQVGKGGKVPYPVGKDLFGRKVYQKVEIPVNPDILKMIAKTTGGKFYLSTDKKKLKDDFADIIDHMEKTRYSSFTILADYIELFPYPLGIFLLLALFEFLLSNTRLRSV